MRVSYSSLDKYKTCPRMWKHHYIDKIRPESKSSALLFGSALDEALNFYLLNIDIEGVVDKTKSIFHLEMDKWESDYKVDFFDKDFDKRLITTEQKQELDNTKDEIKRDHLYGWYCLLNRGMQFIEMYDKDIRPLIEEVISVQKNIKKSNQNGDSITMHLDAVIKWKPCEYNPSSSFISVSDHKTSSNSYSQKRTDESPQLSLYTGFEKVEHQSYIVFRKDLDSKGNIRPIQVLHSKFNEDVFNSLLVEFDEMIESVNNKEFEKTKNKWKCKKMFGKPCIYYDLCYTQDNE